MVRITRDGVTYHPDQLDRRTGEPFTPAAPPGSELTEAQAAAIVLTEAGATMAGVWWTLPAADPEADPVKIQGAVAALRLLRASTASV